MARFTLGLLAVFCLPACLTAEFTSLRVTQPPPEQGIAKLEKGMDLQSCLDLLGAPTSVRRADDGLRTVLAWEWLESGGFGLSFSVPIADQASASVDYGSDSQDSQQIQIFFDAELKVVEISTDGLR